MNFVESLIESFLKLLGSIANAIEQGIAAFVSRLQRIARELARFFVRMVRWVLKAIHSLSIIFLFFAAMFLALNCFMEMGYADYWLISWAGWILFALTFLLLVAALLRMASPSQHDGQQKHHMGVPLLLVNIALLAIIFGTLSYRPLRSPILSYINGTPSAEQSRRGLLAAEPTPRPSVVPVNRKEIQPRPTKPIVPTPAAARGTPSLEESQPAEPLSCTAAASASYTPIAVLEKTEASRPSNGGDAAGEVQVAGTVDREGKIHDLAVSSSSLASEFGEEAIHAVSQWRFTPALWHGEPTGCRLKVTVAFEPKQP